jgi:hypothetical protein
VARGGAGSLGGTAIEAFGRNNGCQGSGGLGLRVIGGNGYSGGDGAHITGGATCEGLGGTGLVVAGGLGEFDMGGTAIRAQGGIGDTLPGIGIVTTGGSLRFDPEESTGGPGLIARGGAGDTGGTGAEVYGENAPAFGGLGLLVLGGSGDVAGDGAHITAGEGATGLVAEGEIGVRARSTDGPQGTALFAEGRVGIGTASATSQLHVSHVGPAVLRLEADTDDANEQDNARIELSQDGGSRTAVLGWRTASPADNAFRVQTAGTSPVVVGTNDVERLRVTGAGNVGIGTSTPGFLLEVAGSAGKPGGGAWSVASDARLKRDVRPLEGALSTLLALRGVRFAYVDPAAIGERPGEQVGFLAQEVEEVLPGWVEEGADGYKRLSIHGFEALAVEALRELRHEGQAQLQRIEDLSRENELLRARIERLEALAGRAESGSPARD